MQSSRLSAKYVPALLGVTVVICFLWIHRAAFSIGFMDEDFAWLFRKSRESVAEFMSPRPWAYYRPFSVNLPYLLLSGLPWLWRAVSFAVVLGSAYFIYRLCERFTAREAAFPLALVWLLSPANLFGLHYFNAFDYALFPFALFGFLHFLLSGQFWPVFAFVFLALGAKELGSLFFLFAWLHWLFFRGRLALPIASTLITIGFNAAKAAAAHGTLTGGFRLVSDPFGLMLNAWNFVQSLFWPFVHRSAEYWYPFAAVVLAAALAALPTARKGIAKQAVLELYFLAACFSLVAGALLLVLEIQYGRMGGIFWGLMLVLAAPFYARRIDPRFWQGAVLCLCLVGRVAAEDSSFYARDRSASQNQFLERTTNHTLRCAPGTTVILDGMNGLFGDSVVSEWVFWGLKIPQAPIKYKLLRRSLDEPIYHLHRRFYVSPEEALKHPWISFSKSGGGFQEQLRNRGGACIDWSS